MKKIIGLSLMFIFALSLMVIINTPAHWVYNQFIKPQLINLPITLAQPKGLAINGSTQIASIPDRMPIPLFVQSLEWYIQPRGLLQGLLMIEVNAREVELAGKALGDYSAQIGWGLDGYHIVINDRNALLKLNAKIDINKRPRQASGQVSLRKQDELIQNLLRTIPIIQADGKFSLNF